MITTPLKSSLHPSHDHHPIPDPYITVTCRLKPLLPQQQKSIIQLNQSLHQITLNDPTKSISKTYSFDQVFDQNVSQHHFTHTICNPLVNFLKNGGASGLIFSYGITNSGKTYTILGTNQQPGILFTLIRKLQQQFPHQVLRIFACQLYKDQFMSLKSKGHKIQPKEFKGTILFDDCDSDEINEVNMESLFQNYLQNRSCAPTNFNNLSSRSHAIFKIVSKSFKIGIVDLAGSERMSKTAHETNVDMKETIFINSSLLTLKKCIKALEERSTLTQKVMVPYRESKLTQALVEYFVNNSKINIIVNVNQASHCLEQNLNALEYTSKAKNIKANVTNDFSKMIKFLSTQKKVEASVIKPKNFALKTQEAKRYSQKIVGEDKYIIDEQMVDAQDPAITLEKEIEKQGRRSEVMMRQQETMYNQLIEGPDVIEQFIEKQRLFRQVYLATDLAIEMEMDERKFSALRKVNLMETTQKKVEPQKPEINYPKLFDSEEFGTQILPGQLINENDELEQKLSRMEYFKLRTEVKRKLMPYFDLEKRKNLVDAETMWSEKKSQKIEKFEENKIEEANQMQKKEVSVEEKSDYTTPNKKSEKPVKSLRKTKNIVKNSQKKGIFTSIAKGAQSTYNGIKLCVKSGAKFITGFGKSSFKSRPEAKNSPPKRKLNLQAQRIFDILIRPESRLIYEPEVQTQVDVVRSSKKVKIVEQQPQLSANGQVEIDLPPVFVEKESIVETYEVGIQTQQMQRKSIMQDSIDANIAQQKIKNQKSKKERKLKGFSSLSDDSTVLQESELSEMDCPEQKNENKQKQSKLVPVQNSKTAFKNFSIKRNDVKVSLKKHKALITNAKSAIAKHTRGAQKKKANQTKVNEDL